MAHVMLLHVLEAVTSPLVAHVMLFHVLEAVTSPLVAHVMLLHVLEGVSSYISTCGTCHVTLSSFYLLNSTKCIQYITCKIVVKTGTDTKQMKD